MIALKSVTKAFSGGRGVFDLSFDVPAGAVFGYLGPNAAGKSTTIRQLMGFLRPDAGSVEINGHNCWTEAPRVQADVGYLPGEIGVPDDMTGTQFLNLVAGLRVLDPSHDRRAALCARFELDLASPLRKMSKGTKQKVGLVAAFMHTPSVLILDEPTSGLDPLMQERFLELVADEKRRGATVFMSSHVFAEVERVADRVGILKDGRLAATLDVAALRRLQKQVFRVRTGTDAEADGLASVGFPVVGRRGLDVDLEVQGDYNALVRALARCDVRALDIHPMSLEQLFMHFYGTEEATTA